MGFFDNLVDGLFNGGAGASDAAMDEYRKIPGQLEKYYNPYIQQGKNAGDKYTQNLDMMMKNNGKDFVNDIYNSYQESPGYKFAAGQAGTAAENAAAAGGTLGTGAHQAQLADYIQGLSSRDQGDYFNRIMSNFNQGQAGYGGIMDRGYNATNTMAGGIVQNTQDMGALAQQKQEAQTRGAMNIFGMGMGALTGGMGGMAMGGAATGLNQGGKLPTPFQNNNSGWSWQGAMNGAGF